MAKRPLGLGKSHKKSKKSKPSTVPENELTIKLSSEADELSQLWTNYAKKKITKEASEEGSSDELILNGIVHECDRILRKQHNQATGQDTKKDEEQVVVDGQLYAIYGLALAELAYFVGEATDADEEFDESQEEEKAKKRAEKVADFFTEALDRIETGLEKFPQDRTVLGLAKCQILANRVPLQYISRMDKNSKKKDFPVIDLLVLEIFDKCEKYVAQLSELDNEKAADLGVFYDYQQYLLYDTLTDVLDMIENFGVNDDLEVDSDTEEVSLIELLKKHPLFEAREHVSEYEDRLISRFESFMKHLKEADATTYKIGLEEHSRDPKYSHNSLVVFYSETNKKLAELYQKKADEAGQVYTDLAYGDDVDEVPQEKLKEAQKIAIDRYKIAIAHVKKTEDQEDPSTWANIAEAEISLGNCYDLNSEEQEKYYKKAEKRLRKANKATNGKYEHILQTLLEDGSE